MPEIDTTSQQPDNSAIAIGSNVASQICQMPNNATAIGSNVASQICQLPNNATPITKES